MKRHVRKDLIINSSIDSIEAYKKFANNIKLLMLQNSLNYLKTENNNIDMSNFYLLDLAYGSGNDVFKYIHSGIQNVAAIDILCQQILDAKQRLLTYIKNRKDPLKFNIKYAIFDALNAPNQNAKYKSEDEIEKFKKKAFNINNFNIVVLNFALNYVNDLENLFKIISNQLSENGIFIGTATDSTRFQSFMKEKKYKDPNHLFDIEIIDDKTYKFRLNSKYFNNITNMSASFISDEGFIIENMLNPLLLNEIAAKYNLYPLNLLGKENNNNIFNFQDVKDIFNLRPQFDMKIKIKLDDLLLSLFFGFSFIKKTENIKPFYIYDDYYFNYNSCCALPLIKQDFSNYITTNNSLLLDLIKKNGMNNNTLEFYKTITEIYLNLGINNNLFLEQMIRNLIYNFNTKIYLQKYIFTSSEERNRYKYKYFAFNKIRPNFKQAVYHIGTIEEFKQELKTIIQNNQKLYDRTLWTFKYMFNVLKKGIFIYIKDNKINSFLPFSNMYYKNTWNHLLTLPPNNNIKIDIKTKNPEISIHDRKIYIFCKKEENIFNENLFHNFDINERINQWYANNGIFKNLVYINMRDPSLVGKPDEGDKTVACILEYFVELCSTKNVPDIAFFVNPRDYPSLKKDFTHPYNALFYPENPPPITEIEEFKNINNNIFLPIFSQSATDDFKDILFPNEQDIVNILNIYPASCIYEPFEKNIMSIWEKKESSFFFRGSATGCGIKPWSNLRIQLALYSFIKSKFPDNDLDVKLTSLNKKLKKDPYSKYINYIHETDTFSNINIDKDKLENFSNKFTVKLQDLITNNKVSKYEFSTYKYIFNIDGHVAAFRLSELFSWNSLVIQLETPWKLWFNDLINGVKLNILTTITSFEMNKEDNFYYFKTKTNTYLFHFIILSVHRSPDKENIDLNELDHLMIFLKKNDNLSKAIAHNGYQFYKNYFNKENLFNYFLNKIKSE